MMRHTALLTLLGCAALLSSALPPAAAARTLQQLPPTLQELMESALLRPFVNAVLTVPGCLSDPMLASFDVQQCPGLTAMLDALSLGNTNPAASCSLPCAQQFAQLSEDCTMGLRAVLGDQESDFGRLATDFFASCDEVLPPMGPGTGASPAASPAPAPAPAA